MFALEEFLPINDIFLSDNDFLLKYLVTVEDLRVMFSWLKLFHEQGTE